MSGRKNRKKDWFPNVFIVLEGLSGSGKTTVGKLLAKKMGAYFYKTPSSLFNRSRKVVDLNADPDSSLLFYLAGVFQSSVEISYILETKSVVCDRYILTTLYYHKALGATIGIPKSLFKRLLKPNYTFLIVREEKKRMQYLSTSHPGYDSLKRKKVEQALLDGYRRHNLIEVDNSINDPMVAVKKILGFLGG